MKYCSKIKLVFSSKGADKLELHFLPKNFFLVCSFLVLVSFLFGWFFSASYFSANLDDSQKELDSRIERLAEAMVRVRSYENQLRMRSTLLNDVISDIGRLDFHGKDLNGSGAGNIISNNSSNPGNKAASGALARSSSLNSASDSQAGNSPDSRLGVGGGNLTDLMTAGHPIKVRHISNDLDTVEGRKFLKIFDKQIDLLSSFPIGTPVDGSISSDFGYRRSPFNGFSQIHTGIDIAVDRKTVVVATGDGKVETSGFLGGYGLAIVIAHDDGIETLYGHLDETSVAEGDRVCRGQAIGYLGSTGMSTGPHVHYEVRVDGVARNPQSFIELAYLLQLLG